MCALTRDRGESRDTSGETAERCTPGVVLTRRVVDLELDVHRVRQVCKVRARREVSRLSLATCPVTVCVSADW